MTEGQIKQLEKKYKELQEENKELKIKNSRLESYCDAYNYSQRTYQEEIKELKELYKKADENWWNAQQTIKELKKQIGQMSNCLNCAFWKDKKYNVCRDIKKLGKICCVFWKLKE